MHVWIKTRVRLESMWCMLYVQRQKAASLTVTLLWKHMDEGIIVMITALYTISHP